MKRLALLMMVLVGTLAGSAVVFGQEAGSLAPPEQQAMSDTVQHALESNKTNQSSDWVNPDTGNSGGVTPVQTFAGAQGEPCREFLSTIVIGGQQQQGYGTACRQPDGTWQIVPDEPSLAQAPPPPAQTDIYVDNPPPDYYAYPFGLFYPYHIYLSFGYVYRGGYLYRGDYFLGGRAFRHRYPIRIRRRIFVTPREHRIYYRFRGWWRYREPERMHRGYEGRMHARYRGRMERRERREWRDRDRGDARWHGR